MAMAVGDTDDQDGPAQGLVPAREMAHAPQHELPLPGSPARREALVMGRGEGVEVFVLREGAEVEAELDGGHLRCPDCREPLSRW